MIQGLARFHPTPIRCKARRIESILTLRQVTPRSKQTSAAKRSVHRLVGFPNDRGVSCKVARSRSHLASSSIGAAVLGLDERARKQRVGPVRTDRIANGLRRAPEVRCDLRRSPATSTGEKDLASSQLESVARAKAFLQTPLFIAWQVTNIHWGLHSLHDYRSDPLQTSSCESALGDRHPHRYRRAERRSEPARRGDHCQL